jgi:hypothetical protein
MNPTDGIAGIFAGATCGSYDNGEVSWCDVILLRDIGRFKKGETMTCASYDFMSTDLTLTKVENDMELTCACKLNVTYDIKEPEEPISN